MLSLDAFSRAQMHLAAELHPDILAAVRGGVLLLRGREGNKRGLPPLYLLNWLLAWLCDPIWHFSFRSGVAVFHCELLCLYSLLFFTLQTRQLNFLGHLIQSENSTYALCQPLYGSNQRGWSCTIYIHCIHKLTGHDMDELLGVGTGQECLARTCGWVVWPTATRLERESVYLKALRCSSVICRYELTDLSSLSSSKTAKLLPANRCIVTAVKWCVVACGWLRWIFKYWHLLQWLIFSSTCLWMCVTVVRDRKRQLWSLWFLAYTSIMGWFIFLFCIISYLVLVIWHIATVALLTLREM